MPSILLANWNITGARFCCHQIYSLVRKETNNQLQEKCCGSMGVHDHSFKKWGKEVSQRSLLEGHDF